MNLEERAAEQIRRSRAAIKRSEEEQARITETLERSRRVTRDAIPVLRAAGILR